MFLKRVLKQLECSFVMSQSMIYFDNVNKRIDQTISSCSQSRSRNLWREPQTAPPRQTTQYPPSLNAHDQRPTKTTIPRLALSLYQPHHNRFWSGFLIINSIHFDSQRVNTPLSFVDYSSLNIYVQTLSWDNFLIIRV